MNGMEQKDKLAVVCQRYGPEVNGGSEQHCRQLAEKLAVYYDVTVYTTCALDYSSWNNYFEEGIEYINGVKVIRFKVQKPRNQHDFSIISEKCFNKKHSDKDEEEWIDSQGPYCPELIKQIMSDSKNYTSVIFMTYLYYTTARGIVQKINNSILIPTVHDEAPVYLRYYDKVFANAKAIVWNTEEEKHFAIGRFPFLKNTLSVIAGVGIDINPDVSKDIPDILKNKKYIVYVGRIDENKGCKELFNYFLRYNRKDSELKLVLIGKSVMPIPNHDGIINLGFVAEKVKFAVIANSVALVLCSHNESLSMVVLESMSVGKPFVVTGMCDVLKGHCIRSNAGLYYNNYFEFEEVLNYLQTHELQCKAMGQNGRKYVAENYQWDVIVNKWKKMISIVKESVKS